MEKSFRQLLNDYFRFSKKDRKGVLMLLGLIIIVIIATIIVDSFQLNGNNDFSEFKKAIAEWEPETENSANNYSLFRFNPNTISENEIDSLLLPKFIKRNILSYRKAGGKFNTPTDLRKIYGMNDSIYAAIEKYIFIPEKELKNNFREEKSTQVVSDSKSYSGSFDPNKADSNTLKKFGFNNYQASNLLKYRESGGAFFTPRDVLKIYGVDSAFYNRIEKHIQIESFVRTSREAEPKITTEPEINIELNSADTAQLIKLPGIGSVFASRIIKYRNLLGGFYSTEQLLDVYNFPEETYRQIEKNISVDRRLIKKIRVNFADFGELIRHPYLESEQVKAILDYRNANGAFQSVDQLEKTGIIDPENVSNIRPYLSCR
jgi:DNA uptake protein ComE-like DNA-binding protein